MKKLLAILLIGALSAAASAQFDIEIDWSESVIPSEITGYEILYLLPDGTQQRLVLADESQSTYAMVVDQEGEYRFAFVGICTMSWGEECYCTAESVVVQTITGQTLLPAIEFEVKQFSNELDPVPPCDAPDCTEVL